jgi:hypothetical protein
LGRGGRVSRRLAQIRACRTIIAVTIYTFLSTVIFVSPAKAAESTELILRCKGQIVSFRGPSWVKDNELIAAHIKNGRITFSGNSLLQGKNIRISRHEDEMYFDSDTCSNVATTETRQYGTFNRISMTLDLTNTTDQIGVQGHFTCAEAK